MALLRSSLSVPAAIAAALLSSSCSSARIDPLEFDYYSSTGDPVDAASTPVIPRRPEQDPVVPISEPVDVPAAPAFRIHRVQKGDSLYALSRHYLGAGKRWREIAQLNGLSDGEIRRLAVGRELKIPAR